MMSWDGGWKGLVGWKFRGEKKAMGFSIPQISTNKPRLKVLILKSGEFTHIHTHTAIGRQKRRPSDAATHQSTQKTAAAATQSWVR